MTLTLKPSLFTAPKRLTVNQESEVWYKCCLKSCLFMSKSFDTCQSHIVNHDRHEGVCTVKYDKHPDYTQCTTEIPGTVIRIDKNTNIAVCHASQTLLSKSEIVPHCMACRYCQVPQECEIPQCREFSNDELQREFQIAGKLKVLGVSAVDFDQLHLPPVIYGTQSKIRVLCKACYDLSNQIVSISPSMASDHTTMVHGGEGGITVGCTAGCVGMVIRRLGDEFTNHPDLPIIATARSRHSNTTATATAKWVDTEELTTLKLLDNFFADRVSDIPADGVEKDGIPADGEEIEGHLVSKYYFQWAYNGVMNYPDGSRRFIDGIFGPFCFQSTMKLARSEFVRLISVLDLVDKSAEIEIDSVAITQLEPFVSHLEHSGDIVHDIDYASYYDLPFQVSSQKNHPKPLSLNELIIHHTSSMPESLCKAVADIHAELYSFLFDKDRQYNALATLLYCSDDPRTCLRMFLYNLRLVALLSGISIPRFESLTNLYNSLPLPNAHHQIVQFQPQLYHEISQAVSIGMRDLSRPRLLEKVAPRESTEIAHRIASLLRLCAIIDKRPPSLLISMLHQLYPGVRVRFTKNDLYASKVLLLLLLSYGGEKSL